MTPREIVLGLLGAAVLPAVLAFLFDLPPAFSLWFAAIVVGGAVLGLALRQWTDRRTATRLASAANEPAGSIEVGWQPQFLAPALGKVTTSFAGDPTWFTLYDLQQSAGLRWLQRAGLGRRLQVDDAEFERAVYVERNPRFGSLLFASPRRREAARAAFGLGFFAIEYRGGLVSLLRRGKVSTELAAAVRPHLAVLAAWPA